MKLQAVQDYSIVKKLGVHRVEKEPVGEEYTLAQVMSSEKVKQGLVLLLPPKEYLKDIGEDLYIITSDQIYCIVQNEDAAEPDVSLEQIVPDAS